MKKSKGMHTKYIYQILLVFVAIITNNIQAQEWNPEHRIGTVGGTYQFNYNQTPQQLVEVISPVIESGITMYYQWEQSARPLDGFIAIGGATGSSYNIPGPLSQTTYYRRKTTLINNNSVYSNIIRIEIVSIFWENINYLKEHTILKPGVTNWVTIDNLAIGDKMQTATYSDGMGRPLQKVNREASTPSNTNSLWNDFVQFSQYDQYGRETLQYLPYSTTTQSGKFKTNSLVEQAQYYSNKYNETSAFNQNSFDNSPANRIINTKLPGTLWAAGTGKSVLYDLNDAADDVQKWKIGYNSGEQPINIGAYAPNELFKTRYTDEQGKQVIEYTNKSGQQILKKIQLADMPSAAHSGWICTYSIYDDFGLLRYRLQPEAVNYLNNNNWSFAGGNGQQIINEWCFWYEYDDKGRNVLKKAPGAQPLRMIYDARNRIVFMQDGNQAAKSIPEFTANIYDELDRVVLTTLYRTHKSISQLQADIASANSSSNITINNLGSEITDLIVESRVAGVSRYAARNSIQIVSTGSTDFVSGSEEEFVAEIDPNALSGTHTTTITTLSNPISTADLNNPSITTVLKYLYYDDYAFSGVKTFSNAFSNTQAYATNGTTIPAINWSKRTLGFVTGSSVRILGTNSFLHSTMYYTDEGMPVQILADNTKTGIDITTSQYHFDGRLLSTSSNHSTAGTGYHNYDILTKQVYDKLGRVEQVQKKLGSNPFTTIANYVYDDMGRLKTKQLAPGYTGSGKAEMEALAYSYNIQNQITGINKDYALKTPGLYNKWDNFFGIYLGYDNKDNAFTSGLQNGQVAGIAWSSQGDDAQRKYEYTYDNAGRLSNAVFNQKEKPTDGWSNSLINLSVTGSSGKISYDLNGNLLGMQQKGVIPGTAGAVLIDDLQYTYASYSNKLIKVMDVSSSSAGGKMGDFKDGTNGSSNDYVYDNNGNLIVDLNKNITGLSGATGILYNHLDKPEQIKITGKGFIKIVYDADGNKLQRSYTPEGGITKTTSYINQYVYEENSLQYIQMEEGRIRIVQPKAENNGYESLSIDGSLTMPEGKKGVWDYFVRDYQQNVRMILTDETHFSSGTASMETARSSIEESVFGQMGGGNEVSVTRFPVANIPGQQSGLGWNNGLIGNSVSRLSKLTNKIGPNSLLKVMAGDALSTTAQYFYKSPASNQPGGSALNDLLVSLAQSIMGSGATNGVTKASAGNITGQLASNTPLSNIVSPHASGTDNIPKSYLSVLFFDERFNFVSEGSTSQRVSGADNSNAALTLANIKAPKNGYAYIYVSNESDEYVYFDNVKVAHTRGRIIEENHYYAFGLKIAGISSKKLGDDNEGSLRNEYGYNDKELWEEGDLNWLDYGFRNYDPQIGRFLQIDPLSSKYSMLSPFLYAFNDPIANVDEDGLEGGTAIVQIFTGVGAQAAADAARMAGNSIGEVIVKSTIKKVINKSFRKLFIDLALKSATIKIEMIAEKSLDGFRNPAKDAYRLERNIIKSGQGLTLIDKILNWFSRNPAGGNQSDKTKVGSFMFGKGGSMEEQNKNERAGPGSDSYDMGDWLDFTDGLRGGADFSDLMRPGRLKNYVEKAEKWKDAVVKFNDAEEKITEKIKDQKPSPVNIRISDKKQFKTTKPGMKIRTSPSRIEPDTIFHY
jgi:RHS repeat-associated protein